MAIAQYRPGGHASACFRAMQHSEPLAMPYCYARDEMAWSVKTSFQVCVDYVSIVVCLDDVFGESISRVRYNAVNTIVGVVFTIMLIYLNYIGYYLLMSIIILAPNTQYSFWHRDYRLLVRGVDVKVSFPIRWYWDRVTFQISQTSNSSFLTLIIRALLLVLLLVSLGLVCAVVVVLNSYWLLFIVAGLGCGDRLLWLSNVCFQLLISPLQLI